MVDVLLFYLKKVLNNNFRASKSTEFVKKLELYFAKKFKSKFAISFSDGTATMHAALEAMNIGYGDEVIVPPLTMSSTTLAVLHSNAKPIFADVDLKTFQIDPDNIEKKITKKTKAIITVALYGLSPDLDRIKKIASKYKLKIIEDNAECFMGLYKKKIVGTIGDCASFSFQNSKHITCGKGGILISIGHYVFDTENLSLTIQNSKKSLTKKEAQILKLLYKFNGQVLPREVILNAVWGQNDYFVGRSLDVFITKLRKYLKDDDRIVLSNIHGVGFKLEIIK